MVQTSRNVYPCPQLLNEKINPFVTKNFSLSSMQKGRIILK